MGRGDESRLRILSAAAEELAGTGDLQVAAVAARAGVSAGLPYRYFRTRTALLIALVRDFYDRLGEAAALRRYPQPSWAERERRRIRDWMTFLYDDRLAPVILGGLVGDGAVAAANAAHLRALIDIGARNIAQAQRDGDLPAGRDPQVLAAATLGGTHAVALTALARSPRTDVESLIDELWSFVSGAVGLPVGAAGPERLRRRGRSTQSAHSGADTGSVTPARRRGAGYGRPGRHATTEG